MPQRSGDAALQEGLRPGALGAGGGPHQLQPRLLAKVIELHQLGVAAVEAGGDAVRKGQMSVHQGIAVVVPGRVAWFRAANARGGAHTAGIAFTVEQASHHLALFDLIETLDFGVS